MHRNSLTTSAPAAAAAVSSSSVDARSLTLKRKLDTLIPEGAAASASDKRRKMADGSSISADEKSEKKYDDSTDNDWTASSSSAPAASGSKSQDQSDGSNSAASGALSATPVRLDANSRQNHKRIPLFKRFLEARRNNLEFIVVPKNYLSKNFCRELKNKGIEVIDFDFRQIKFKKGEGEQDYRANLEEAYQIYSSLMFDSHKLMHFTEESMVPFEGKEYPALLLAPFLSKEGIKVVNTSQDCIRQRMMDDGIKLSFTQLFYVTESREIKLLPTKGKFNLIGIAFDTQSHRGVFERNYRTYQGKIERDATKVAGVSKSNGTKSKLVKTKTEFKRPDLPLSPIPNKELMKRINVLVREFREGKLENPELAYAELFYGVNSDTEGDKRVDLFLQELKRSESVAPSTTSSSTAAVPMADSKQHSFSDSSSSSTGIMAGLSRSPTPPEPDFVDLTKKTTTSDSEEEGRARAQYKVKRRITSLVDAMVLAILDKRIDAKRESFFREFKEIFSHETDFSMQEIVQCIKKRVAAKNASLKKELRDLFNSFRMDDNNSMLIKIPGFEFGHSSSSGYKHTQTTSVATQTSSSTSMTASASAVSMNQLLQQALSIPPHSNSNSGSHAQTSKVFASTSAPQPKSDVPSASSTTTTTTLTTTTTPTTKTTTFSVTTTTTSLPSGSKSDDMKSGVAPTSSCSSSTSVGSSNPAPTLNYAEMYMKTSTEEAEKKSKNLVRRVTRKRNNMAANIPSLLSNAQKQQEAKRSYLEGALNEDPDIISLPDVLLFPAEVRGGEEGDDDIAMVSGEKARARGQEENVAHSAQIAASRKSFFERIELPDPGPGQVNPPASLSHVRK